MADGSLARRYARALLSIGQEGGLLDTLSTDLHGVQSVLDLGAGELRSALSNPGITLAERRAALEAVLGKLDLNANSGNFLRLLLDKGRFFALDDIIREFGVLSDEIAGRVRATVTTAKPLTKALSAKVAKSLEDATGKTVEVTYEVDADVIGGLVAKVGDTVYDAPIRSRLIELQAAIGAGHVAEA